MFVERWESIQDLLVPCISALYLLSPARFHACTNTHTHTQPHALSSHAHFTDLHVQKPHVYMYTPYTLIPPPQMPHIHTTPPILLYTQYAHRTHPHPSKPTMSHSHSCVLIPSEKISLRCDCVALTPSCPDARGLAGLPEERVVVSRADRKSLPHTGSLHGQRARSLSPRT